MSLRDFPFFVGNDRRFCKKNFLSKRPSSDVFFEELVLSNLIASPLMKPYLTPKLRVNWRVSVGL